MKLKYYYDEETGEYVMIDEVLDSSLIHLADVESAPDFDSMNNDDRSNHYARNQESVKKSNRIDS